LDSEQNPHGQLLEWKLEEDLAAFEKKYAKECSGVCRCNLPGGQIMPGTKSDV
jgi:hypothetical protein